jgi:hypothetical protein
LVAVNAPPELRVRIHPPRYYQGEEVNATSKPKMEAIYDNIDNDPRNSPQNTAKRYLATLLLCNQAREVMPPILVHELVDRLLLKQSVQVPEEVNGDQLLVVNPEDVGLTEQVHRREPGSKWQNGGGKVGVGPGAAMAVLYTLLVVS